MIAGNPFGVLHCHVVLPDGAVQFLWGIADYPCPVTAVVLLEDTLVLADKKGSVATYHSPPPIPIAGTSFPHIHRNGKVNAICPLSDSRVATCDSHASVIILTKEPGDGVWSHTASIHLCNLLTTILHYSDDVVVGMRGDALHVLHSGDHVSYDRRVLSTTRRSLHWNVVSRSAYLVACGADGVDIRYTRDNAAEATTVMRRGLHGHDIHDVCAADRFVVCVCEDTTVSVSEVTPSGGAVRRVSVGHMHDSGVRACCAAPGVARWTARPS